MTDPVVYGSIGPVPAEVWTEACDALDAYDTAIEGILDEAGLKGWPIISRMSPWSYGKFAGISRLKGQEPPAGWRLVRDNYYIPDKRRKAGQAIEAAVNAVEYPGAPLSHVPGMPGSFLHQGYVISPEVRLLEERLYVKWNADPAERTGQSRGNLQPVDLVLWERLRLSQYYLMVEAEQDRKGASNVAG